LDIARTKKPDRGGEEVSLTHSKTAAAGGVPDTAGQSIPRKREEKKYIYNREKLKENLT